MNLNLGHYEDRKTFVSNEFSLESLCKDGAMFDLSVRLDNETEEQEEEQINYSEDVIENICHDLNPSESTNSLTDLRDLKITDTIKDLDNEKTIHKSSSTESTNNSSTNITLTNLTSTAPVLSPTHHSIIFPSSTSFEEVVSNCVAITNDKGVMKQILRHGNGPVVGPKANITAHYNAYLEFADEPFDSTRLRQDVLNMDIGFQSAIVGFEIALSTMKKKELARFVISPEYAYGPRGCPPRIPPNSSFLYVIELISFKMIETQSDDYFNLPMRERRNTSFEAMMQALQTVLQKSRSYFQRGDFNMAAKTYSQALAMLDSHMIKDEKEEHKWKEMLKKVLLDLAVCFLRQSLPYRTLHYCSRLLALNYRNVKALYLKGKALRQIGEFERSKTCLEKADKLRPGCPDIQSELNTVARQLKRIQICVKSTKHDYHEEDGEYAGDGDDYNNGDDDDYNNGDGDNYNCGDGGDYNGGNGGDYNGGDGGDGNGYVGDDYAGGDGSSGGKDDDGCFYDGGESGNLKETEKKYENVNSTTAQTASSSPRHQSLYSDKLKKGRKI